MINNQPISILIDPGASLSYISPRVVDLCNLVPEKFGKSWLVQLSIGTKRKVASIVTNCKIMMNDFLTHLNVNIFPLGSYDLLIQMDWLEEHKVLYFIVQASNMILGSLTERITCTAIKHKHNTRDRRHKEFS